MKASKVIQRLTSTSKRRLVVMKIHFGGTVREWRFPVRYGKAREVRKKLFAAGF